LRAEAAASNLQRDLWRRMERFWLQRERAMASPNKAGRSDSVEGCVIIDAGAAVLEGNNESTSNP
jgi:hypothetical protein